MSDEIPLEAPRIVFPCDYPLKVIGQAHESFRASVLTVVRRHVAGFDESSVQLVDSRNGRFLSLRLVIRAEGEAHIRGLFEEIRLLPNVHLVL